MLSLDKIISKSAFDRLLAECINTADTFSLTEGPKLYPEGKALLDALQPYLIKTIETQHWFSYYVPKSCKKRVYIFKVCEESVTALKEFYKGLFVDEDTRWTTLEDLCFFLNKKLVLGTVTHEYICYFYPPTEELNEQFKELCDWQEAEDNLNERISYE